MPVVLERIFAAMKYPSHVLVLGAGTWALPAAGFDLAFPLDCSLGESCFIQQYIDRDAGPGAQDFTCGPLVYDGHEGTDFALPTLADMKKGVAVKAAASGIVKGARDGVADVAVNDPAAPPLDGRDCGNGVLIDHGEGWQTQYCHMKQGSITLSPGDPVLAGETLGLVGLSGNTEFPHLHVSVRKNDVEIDPFDPDNTLNCGTAAPQLWADPIAYRPGGIVGLGIATEVPAFETILEGLPSPQSMKSDAPAIVLWAHLFGGRAGDVLVLSVTSPDGAQLFDEMITLEKNQARAFRALGKRLTSAAWPLGAYQSEAILFRDGTEVDRAVLGFTIVP